jgi:MYXO-CTERM domain-containing protein
MRWFLPIVLVGAVGCGDETEAPFGEGDDDPFAKYDPAELTPGNAVAFSGASAPAMLGAGLAPLIVSQIGMDETCPKVTQGSTVVYEGDCTRDDGTRILGRATVKGNSAGGGTITYEAYGYAETEACNTVEVDEQFVYTGTMTITESAPGHAAYSLDVTVELTAADDDSCATQSGTTDYEYDGSYAGEAGEDGSLDMDRPSTWNGSGRLGVQGYGQVNATTDDELLDRSVCTTEAVSGRTSIESAGDVVVVDYDGADDCDPESTARWSFNGEDQGELTGVQCTASPGAKPNAWPLALLAVLALARRPRRR